MNGPPVDLIADARRAGVVLWPGPSGEVMADALVGMPLALHRRLCDEPTRREVVQVLRGDPDAPANALCRLVDLVGCATLDELAKASGLHPVTVYRLLEHLADTGAVREVGGARWALAPAVVRGRERADREQAA